MGGYMHNVIQITLVEMGNVVGTNIVCGRVFSDILFHVYKHLKAKVWQKIHDPTN